MNASKLNNFDIFPDEASYVFGLTYLWLCFAGYISNMPTNVQAISLNSINSTIPEPRQGGQEPSKTEPTKSELFLDFINNTTQHGVRYIFRPRFKCLRFLWLAVIVSFVLYYGYIVRSAVRDYFSYPITTSIGQKYVSEMDFPAITICPQSLLQKSKLSIADSDVRFSKLALNLTMCAATALVRAGRPCGLSLLCILDFFQNINVARIIPFCTARYKMELFQALKIAAVPFSGSKFILAYSTDIANIWAAPLCTFGILSSKTCKPADFEPILTKEGVCFTFNSGKGREIIKDSESQAIFLSIALDTQLEEYIAGKLSQGFVLYVHQQDEYLSPRYGVLIGPGTHAGIVVSSKRFTYLPHPYPSKCGSKRLNTFPTYTTDGCFFECTAEEITRRCGCYVRSYRDNFDKTDKCDCPVSCESVHYDIEVSYSKFPTKWISNMLGELGYNKSYEYQKENLALVQVGFKSLSYEHQEQRAAFDFEAFLGQVGGNMGLFLGCSFLTLFEFIDFLVVFVLVRKCRRNIPV